MAAHESAITWRRRSRIFSTATCFNGSGTTSGGCFRDSSRSPSPAPLSGHENTKTRNLPKGFRAFRSFRGDPRGAYLLGLLLAFDISLGFNGFTYPLLYDYIRPFRGLRIPARMGLLVAFSLAVLAGYGVVRLTDAIRSRVRAARARCLPGIRAAGRVRVKAAHAADHSHRSIRSLRRHGQGSWRQSDRDDLRIPRRRCSTIRPTCITRHFTGRTW